MAWTDPTTRSNSEFIEATDWNTDVTNNLLYLLSVVEPATLTNGIGESAVKGTVIIQDTTGDNTFTTTTTDGDTVIGVAGELIADGDTGNVITSGVGSILVAGNVSAGEFLVSSTTAGRSRSIGRHGGKNAFAVAITSYSGGGNGAVAGFIFCSKTLQSQVAPSGLTMFIADNIAPPEHTAYSSTAGRVIIGLPSGGTNEGTVGSALTDLEQLTATHTHTYTAMPTHTHTVTISNGLTAGAESLYLGAANAEPFTTTSDQSTNGSQGASATTNTGTTTTMPYIQLLAIERD